MFCVSASICATSDTQVAKTSSGNAFDDILYNSDSDASDDDDEAEGQTRGRPIKPLAKGKAGKREEKTKRREDGQTYIRNEGDEPMDLLSRSIAGGISSKFKGYISCND
jgi:ribosomal RNA-processing protein 12